MLIYAQPQYILKLETYVESLTNRVQPTTIGGEY